MLSVLFVVFRGLPEPFFRFSDESRSPVLERLHHNETVLLEIPSSLAIADIDLPVFHRVTISAFLTKDKEVLAIIH